MEKRNKADVHHNALIAAVYRNCIGDGKFNFHVYRFCIIIINER